MHWQEYITGLNVLVAVFLWAPSAVRIVRRKSSADYSIYTFLMVSWLQWSNLAIAYAASNTLHVYWFALNGVLCGGMAALVFYYRRGNGWVRERGGF